MGKPILCLDFDGVLHSYTSGWQGADVIPDPPVSGAATFLMQALERFDVHIYSSRSNQSGGIDAMQEWLAEKVFRADSMSFATDHIVYERIQWPLAKPPALVTIDDRAITFDGTWPAIETLLAFRPWNKK